MVDASLRTLQPAYSDIERTDPTVGIGLSLACGDNLLGSMPVAALVGHLPGKIESQFPVLPKSMTY